MNKEMSHQELFDFMATNFLATNLSLSVCNEGRTIFIELNLRNPTTGSAETISSVHITIPENDY